MNDTPLRTDTTEKSPLDKHRGTPGSVEAPTFEKDGAMPSNGKYPDELRERAVRMVLDHGHEYGSQWEAMCSVAEKLGPKPETVRLWVRQAEKDTGRRPGATTDELAELKRLKRENAELRRANDILKAAAHFFGAELDRQSKK